MSIARTILAAAAVTGAMADTSLASTSHEAGASAIVDQSPIKASAAFAAKAIQNGKLMLSFVKDGGPSWVQFVKHVKSENDGPRSRVSVAAAFDRNIRG